MCLLSILSATTWQQHLALWNPLFQTTKAPAPGAARLIFRCSSALLTCVGSEKGSSVFLPGWMTTLTVRWSCLLIRLHWFRAWCYSFLLHEWMNDGSHALQNECVCVSLGWMHTVSNINYVTWCTGAYWRVCLAYPFHRAERVSEWTERRDGVENS